MSKIIATAGGHEGNFAIIRPFAGAGMSEMVDFVAEVWFKLLTMAFQATYGQKEEIEIKIGGEKPKAKCI